MPDPPIALEADDALPDAEETFTQSHDGASLFARVAGPTRARGILILDGIGCSGWAFRRIVPLLARRHRVALMHYRGHGRSPNPPRPWHLGIHELADDAARVIEVLELDRPLVVGFSMGFQVALELYKRHRGLVGGLASLAGPSGQVLSSFQGTDAARHFLPVLKAATRYAEDWTLRVWQRVLPSNAFKWLGLQTQLNADRIELVDLEFYLSQMAKMSPELFVEMLSEAARHCAADVLPRVRVPTLVIAGGQDRFVPLATMREVAFSIPGAQWVVIPDASHALPAEYPDEIAHHLLRFAGGMA